LSGSVNLRPYILLREQQLPVTIHFPENDRSPYGRQTITEADTEAVSAVLRSDWLTTGPKVAEFEGALAELVGVSVNSGTAALHCAMAAIGIAPGDEVFLRSLSLPPQPSPRSTFALGL
jgi:dTDP-4-amino-4,6-dideoxygalactose transaminase